MKATIDLNENTAIICEWRAERDGAFDAKPIEVELDNRMRKLIEGWVNTVQKK